MSIVPDSPAFDENPIIPSPRLSRRRCVFVDFYLGEAHWNATQAARLAGYRDAHNEAWRLLRDPRVQRLINERLNGKDVEAPKGVARRLRRLKGGHQQAGRQPKAVVYFIQAENGLVKIGRTNDLEGRLRQFQSLLPCSISVLHIIECKDPAELERQYHQRFAALRVRGEWFSLSEQDIAGL